MHWLHEMYKWHPVMMGAIGMGLANALVTTMPTPDEKSGKLYQWAFNFLHAAVLSISRIVSQYKQEPPKP